MQELTPFEDAFLTAYVQNGFIGTRAWLAVRPHVANNTAGSHAATLLAQPHMKIALKQRVNSLKENIEITKPVLIKDARRIMDKAENKGQFSAALKSVDIQANLTGAYSHDEEDATKYTAFINQLTINMSNNKDNSTNDNQVRELMGVSLLDSSKVIDIDNPNEDDRDNQYTDDRMSEVG